MADTSESAAQHTAQAQGIAAALAVGAHRQQWVAMRYSRAGMCLASGWELGSEPLDAEFDFDDPLLQRLLQGPADGPAWRAAPPPARRRGTAAAGGPSMLQRMLHPEAPSAPLGSARRLGEELPGAVYGPGNLLANASAATAGALHGLHEHKGAQLIADGIEAIAGGRAQRVALGPGVELYNSARPRQLPRVRLRVRGLPISTVRAMVPTTGGPVTQWRVNGAGSAATLKVQGMTAQQMRNTAILAAEQRMPSALRWASGGVGGGILTFGPSALIDAYDAVGTDLQTGRTTFDGQRFLLAQARNQSGNAVGMGAGMIVTGAVVVFGGAAAAASAPVLLLALGTGIVAQVVWNWSGGADAAEGLMRQALQ